MAIETIICRNCNRPFKVRRIFENRNAMIFFCWDCKHVEYRDERQPESDEDGHYIIDITGIADNPITGHKRNRT